LTLTFQRSRRALALEQALLLLLLADVQEVLEHDGAVLGEQALEVRDVAVALFPQAARHQVVHPHHQHVLVVRAVEDGELRRTPAHAVHAPQEVVAALLRGRHAEGDTRTPRGLRQADDVLDRRRPLPAPSRPCSTIIAPFSFAPHIAPAAGTARQPRAPRALLARLGGS
jgi:hypothetical protein